MNLRTPLIFLFVAIVLFSCKEDEPVIDPIYTEIVFPIDENPEAGQFIGVVPNTSGSTTLQLTYMDQNPQGAVDYNPETRTLTVANPELFDFETMPELYVFVRGKSDKIINEIEITVALNDVYTETNLTITEIAGPLTPNFRSPDFSDYLGTVTYENDLLKQIRSEFTNGYSELTVEAYQDDMVQRLHEFSDDGEADPVDQYYDLTLDSEGRVETIFSEGTLGTYNYNLEHQGTQVTFSDQIFDRNGSVKFAFNTGRILNYDDGETTMTFEYNAGNLLKLIVNDSTEVRYFYDQKRNPFQDTKFSNVWEIMTLINVVKGLNDPNIGSGFRGIYGNQGFKNRNNIVLIEVTNPNFGLRDVQYEFQYNSDGYPLEKKIMFSDVVLNYLYE